MKKKWIWILIVSALVLGSLYFALRFPQAYFRSDWVTNFLRKKDFSKNWRWAKFDLRLRSDHFLEYKVQLNVEDLDIDMTTETMVAAGHVPEIKADYLVKFGLRGMRLKALSPLLLKIGTIDVSTIKENKPPEKREPFLWKDLLEKVQSSLIRDFNVSADQITLSSLNDGKKRFVLGVSKLILSSNDDSFTINARLKFSASLAEAPLEITLDKESLRAKTAINSVPYAGPLSCDLRLSNLDETEEPSPFNGHCAGLLKTKPLVAGTVVKVPSELDFSGSLSPKMELKQLKLTLQSAKKEADAKLSFHYDEDFLLLLQNKKQLVQALLAKTELNLKIPKLNAFLATFPEGFRRTPAPLNSMDGPVELQVNAAKDDASLTVIKLSIDLADNRQHQRFKLDVNARLPWKFIGDNAIPSLQGPEIDLALQKLVLVLPRVRLTESMPGLIKDSRIKHTTADSKKSSTLDWNLDIATDQPLVLRTSLLKNTPIRLSLHFELNEDGMKSGHLDLLPLETTILKRPIAVQKLTLNWPEYGKAIVDGLIQFKLPEYRISLKLAGPINSPRTAFESSPPLSANDIYSVLLFGRPMSEIDPEGREAASRVKYGLTQGLFSLSTLYLLSGTPIESVGYDAETGDVSAQIRLSKKNSLRVGTQDGGLGTVAVRRSLGHGWYIESQAQEANADSTTGNTNFGLMLQRIIAY